MSSQNFGASLTARLSQAGISQRFSMAVKAGDIPQMKTLLRSVNYSNEAIDAMIETFIESPETFTI